MLRAGWRRRRILADLAAKDKEVTLALVKAVEDPDPSVRLEAIRALGKLGAEASLPCLLEKIKQGGPESAAAAEAASRLGARAIHTLQDLMGDVAPGLRRRIAGALAGSGTQAASSAAVQVLLDPDPGVVDAAARSLLGELPGFSAARERDLADGRSTPSSRARDPASRRPPKRPCFAYSQHFKMHAPCRSFGPASIPTIPRMSGRQALQALGSLAGPIKKDHLSLLLTCAWRPSFRVAAPALLLLKPLEVSARQRPSGSRCSNRPILRCAASAWTSWRT